MARLSSGIYGRQVLLGVKLGKASGFISAWNFPWARMGFSETVLPKGVQSPTDFVGTWNCGSGDITGVSFGCPRYLLTKKNSYR